ncbi:MAG: hypothetical protein WC325_04665 [Candidatus Bathyarchaeia archaeon]|jgi:hypothetical protein
MPVCLIFDYNNPQNREADKYLLGTVLTGLGVALTVTGFGISLVSKRRKNTEPVL